MACAFSILRPPHLTVTCHADARRRVRAIKPHHADADLDADASLGHRLLSYPDPSSALAFFRSLPFIPSSSFPYNALLRTLSRARAHSDVLSAYALMRSRSIPCDRFALPLALRSASVLSYLPVGLEIHSLSLKTGLFAILSFRTALIDLYCSCGLPARALQMFDRTNQRDLVCWNTMIAGLVKCELFDDARILFDEMPERNVSSWNTIIDMYCKVENIETARRLFDEMPERNVVSWNVMVSGYAKISDCDAARELFDMMANRNVVSWNVMITSYVQCRRFSDALGLFRAMQRENVSPDEVTVVAILPACSHLGALNIGQWVHAYIRRNKIKMDVFVATALIDMYGKCGCIGDAWRVFQHSKKKDAFLCSTMIDVFAMHGRAKEAFEVFDYMRSISVEPNDVTFVGLLKACAHVGLLQDGLRCFHMMQMQFRLVPKVEHYGCMVDLLGRTGHLEEACELISSMPTTPPVVWASLLSSCRIHGNIQLAEEAALRLIELEPDSSANYVLLANTYSKANRWEDAAKLRRMMKDGGVMKKPGCSSIEVNNVVHEFYAGDRQHADGEEIYKMLNQIVVRLKLEGYEPCTSSTLHDVDRDGKEQALIHHSEKLALAFGLMATEKGATIRIVKNIRVCDDCHIFFKLASKCYGREVIVRDCHRFHHFSDGSCSCSDYW